MKLKLEPYEELSKGEVVVVPNVYEKNKTKDGETLIEYHRCGSHAFYVSPKVLLLLEEVTP